MTTAVDLNNPFSTRDLKRVRAIRFSIFDADTIVGYSVAEVTTIDVYEHGQPIMGGINDPRLGPIDIRSFCASCGGGMKECPGHWGHLTLAKPMYHWGFMKATHNVLRCVCYYCSRLLGDPRDHRMVNASKMLDKKKKLQAVMLCCRTKKRCAVSGNEPAEVQAGATGEDAKKFAGGCGYIQPRYNVDCTVLYVSFPDGGDEEGGGQDRKRPLAAEETLTIFRRISNEDVRLMGFDPARNHPKNMLLTHMAIPPPAVRPTISFGAERSEDDVTAKLLDIAKVNFQLKTQAEAGAGDHIVQEFAKLLQYHIYTLNDNCIIGIPQAVTKSKRPLKSIRERLKSKEGRLRGTLMGKRVDFCARSVIGGDPNLNTEQVGVPRSVALNLTFPERVTPHNMDLMRSYVDNGPAVWPGARYIIRDDGSRIDLRYVPDTTTQKLQYGWKVERHMIDGDYIIFNRQPSLHKMSMMGHRVKVMPFSTLRFNLAVTSPYNADFDGDEMNLHLGQTHETRSEIKHMMLNPRMVVSPQGNKPVMGIVQDSLLATAKYTKRDTFLEKDLAMNILMWLPVWDGQLPTPAILRPKEMWTGKQLLSMILPKGLSMKRDSAIASKNKKDDPNFAASDCKVLVQDGEILSGIVCKKTIGASSGSMIHLIWLDYGPEVCRNFISFLQKMVNQWLTHNGFSCGVADIIANEETLFNVEKTLKQAKVEVRKILADAQRGKLETQPGKTMYQSFEAKVNQRLNAAREDAGRIGSDSLDERNNIISMVNAGSKGSPINIAQIIACVGQQNVEGARIRYGFIDRTLPHFTKDDYGAESRGFVENSYLAGLTPQEVWMHAMGGREGVIDTACKTSETGYIQRRLVKSMETLRVCYDGTSRNANNDIIQFLYGEDGMDGLWIEDQGLDLMTYDNKKLESTYRHDYMNEDYGVKWLDSGVLMSIKSNQENQAVLDMEWAELVKLKEMVCKEVFTDGDSKQHMPINMPRLIGRAKARGMQEDRAIRTERYTPMDVVKKVEELMASLEITRAIAEGDTIGREVEDNAKIVLNAHLRGHLASRKLLEQDQLSKQSIDWLLGEVKQRFMKSCCHPGEVVGVLAAQSVGEPATQMTLNTFHFAGVGAKNVTLGVPRLKELINVAKTVKTPSLAVYLKGDLAKDQERAKDVQSTLEHTTLEKVTSFTQIFWDPDPTNTRVPEDKEWVAEYYELPDEDDNPDKCGAWVLRLQLSNKVMTDKKLTVREVGERIIKDFMGDLDCIFTDDNAEELVLRIRLLKEVNELNQDTMPFDPTNDKDDRDYKFLRSIEANILKEMTLKGIHGIKKVFMREDTLCQYKESAGKFERSKEWVLDTDGVNLEEVMQIPDIDFTRLQSNDIVEILNVLGIEATRKALLFHVRMVISFDGSYVNYRHLGTLCDVMTNRGHLMAITRHGVNRTNMGPLMKCSFEETVEILMDAAIYDETDYMRSVSENIIVGQLVPIGTGIFDIYMDDKRVQTDDLIETCPLDQATHVLQQAKRDETFSMASPVGSPRGQSPVPGVTPHEDDAGEDLCMQTGGTLADFMGTPMMTPGDEDKVTGTRSPFSPPELAASSPFSASSPMSEVPSPLATEQTSPHSVAMSHTPTSPVYSPAVAKSVRGDQTPSYMELTPTYLTPRSPAYTPSSTKASSKSGTHTGSSSAFAMRSRGDRGDTSSSRTGLTVHQVSSPAWSPTYSPTTASAASLGGPFGYGGYGESPVTSPAYTPMSAPAYTATSPLYSPTSPHMEGARHATTSSPMQAYLTSERMPETEGQINAGSPVIQVQMDLDDGPDEPTSPSYTPHQGYATGDVQSEHRSGTQITEDLDDAQSSLFEPSDDEDDELYSPPGAGAPAPPPATGRAASTLLRSVATSTARRQARTTTQASAHRRPPTRERPGPYSMAGPSGGSSLPSGYGRGGMGPGAGLAEYSPTSPAEDAPRR